MFIPILVHLIQKSTTSCDSNISGTQLVEKVGWIFYNEFKRKQIVWGRTKEKPSPLPLP